jgi:hypothetical protein
VTPDQASHPMYSPDIGTKQFKKEKKENFRKKKQDKIP